MAVASAVFAAGGRRRVGERRSGAGAQRGGRQSGRKDAAGDSGH